MTPLHCAPKLSRTVRLLFSFLVLLVLGWGQSVYLMSSVRRAHCRGHATQATNTFSTGARLSSAAVVTLTFTLSCAAPANQVRGCTVLAALVISLLAGRCTTHYLRLSSSHLTGPKGISCVILEKDTPGLSFGAKERKVRRSDCLRPQLLGLLLANHPSLHRKT